MRVSALVLDFTLLLTVGINSAAANSAVDPTHSLRGAARHLINCSSTEHRNKPYCAAFHNSMNNGEGYEKAAEKADAAIAEYKKVVEYAKKNCFSNPKPEWCDDEWDFNGDGTDVGVRTKLAIQNYLDGISPQQDLDLTLSDLRRTLLALQDVAGKSFSGASAVWDARQKKREEVKMLKIVRLQTLQNGGSVDGRSFKQTVAWKADVSKAFSDKLAQKLKGAKDANTNRNLQEDESDLENMDNLSMYQKLAQGKFEADLKVVCQAMEATFKEAIEDPQQYGAQDVADEWDLLDLFDSFYVKLGCQA